MRMKNDTPLFERQTITICFVITFIITIMLGAAYQFTNNAFISPQYAPTIGVVILCIVRKDWSIWREMIQNTFRRQVSFLWIFVALLLPFILIIISTLLMSLFGSQFIPWQATTSGFISIIIITILGCVFEEIGWRGYLFPKFAEKQTVYHSSIGVGLLWGVWHLKFTYGILGFILFVLLIICFSILMGWIYIKPKGVYCI